MSDEQRDHEKRIATRAAEISAREKIPEFLARIRAASEVSREAATSRAARAEAMGTHCLES